LSEVNIKNICPFDYGANGQMNFIGGCFYVQRNFSLGRFMLVRLALVRLALVKLISEKVLGLI
jgi:hypothetical protein